MKRARGTGFTVVQLLVLAAAAYGISGSVFAGSTVFQRAVFALAVAAASIAGWAIAHTSTKAQAGYIANEIDKIAKGDLTHKIRVEEGALKDISCGVNELIMKFRTLIS